jgi:hypothetical protein
MPRAMDDPHALIADDRVQWLLNQLQWPAALVGIVGAWLVGALARRSRRAGFWCFLVSNALWISWGVLFQHWGLVLMQAAFTVTSLRGVITNRGADVSAR